MDCSQTSDPLLSVPSLATVASLDKPRVVTRKRPLIMGWMMQEGLFLSCALD